MVKTRANTEEGRKRGRKEEGEWCEPSSPSRWGERTGLFSWQGVGISGTLVGALTDAAIHRELKVVTEEKKEAGSGKIAQRRGERSRQSLPRQRTPVYRRSRNRARRREAKNQVREGLKSKAESPAFIERKDITTRAQGEKGGEGGISLFHREVRSPRR